MRGCSTCWTKERRFASKRSARATACHSPASGSRWRRCGRRAAERTSAGVIARRNAGHLHIPSCEPCVGRVQSGARRKPQLRDPSMATSFKTIRARAEKRKGGAKALEKLLPPKPDLKALAKLGDDRVLAEMTRRVFCAGFAWSVIDNKWEGFEEAFMGFAPGPLSLQPDEFWDELLSNKRIVRNGAKIMSVRANAGFVKDVAKEYGSFGTFLASWPSSDEIGLLDFLVKRGNRLGGNTGLMLLRLLGWDGFVTSRDVVSCLRDAGLDVAESVTSKRDLAKV